VYYLLAIAALGFLIVVHEGGHYFVARWCQMRIARFSIGFGPGILKRTSKKTGTTFQLAPIPFGGFVEIQGMNIAEDVDPEDKHAYPNRPAWQRFLTIFAGPATNYLSAIVLAMALYTCHGVDVAHWYGVGDVMQGYSAYGKLERGDRILEVDHVPLFIDSGASLIERVNAAKGAPLTLAIERTGEKHEIAITPRLDNEESAHARHNFTEIAKLAPALSQVAKIISDRLPDPVWRIGVKPEPQYVVLGIGVVDSVGRALRYPIDQTKMIGAGLYGIVFGNEVADPGGPKRMVEEFHRAFSAGLVPGIKLLMLLSVYLGLFNLFPLPALDGGRLVFLGYEMVTRRRANPKLEAMVHMAGIMVLGVVMILVTLHDFHVL
jgi:regulator of sigma E protease